MLMAYDVVVIGAGPNGLAAAVELQRRGRTVLVVEGEDSVGGAFRTDALTLPGFRHDVGAAIHGMGAASPFFRSLPLRDHGLELIDSPVLMSHPLDDGSAVALHRSVSPTASGLGNDGPRYDKMIRPFVERSDDILGDVLRPVMSVPRHPITWARFGALAAMPATVAYGRFEGERAKALFAGIAAHSVVPLDRPFTTGVVLVLLIAGHAHGWPISAGGSQAIPDALASHLRELGGEIVTGQLVGDLSDIPEAKSYVFDTMPGAVARIAKARLPSRIATKFARWRHGPGVFKLDWALEGPIPWRDDTSSSAATVHLGGTAGEIERSEAMTWKGTHPERPFVILAQQSLFDQGRAPAGKQTAWAYCHVPVGSDKDMTVAIEQQIERFAPGFRDLIVARSTLGPADLEAGNPNLVGGDITGGAMTFSQIVARPRIGFDPYRLGNGLFMCSSATPPGAGGHGMCGYNAAQSVVRADG